MRTPTPVLAEAMRVLSIEVMSDDGVANAAIAEAGQRIDELHGLLLTVFKQFAHVMPPRAPGHNHHRPGYWGTGKPCEWCAAWQRICDEVASPIERTVREHRKDGP